MQESPSYMSGVIRDGLSAVIQFWDQRRWFEQ